MDSLSEELTMKVLTFLPPLELLRSVQRTSRSLSILIASNKFWCNHPACPADYKEISMNLHQIQRFCIYRSQKESINELARSLRTQPLLPTREEALEVAGGRFQNNDFQNNNNDTATARLLGMVTGLINRQNNRSAGGLRKCCAASTTHHYSEDIANVLFDPAINNNHIMEEGTDSGPSARWWSSSPSESSDSTDMIMFACRYPLAVLSQLRIQALRDPHRGHHSYTWKMSVVRAYRYPSLTIQTARGSEEFVPLHFPAVQCDNHQSNRILHQRLQQRGGRGLPFTAPPDKDTIENTLQGLEPVYESEAFAMPDSHRVVTFYFPPGIIANLIVIELIGKNHEQFQGQGYYACVDRVGLLGIPLLRDPWEAQHLLNF